MSKIDLDALAELAIRLRKTAERCKEAADGETLVGRDTARMAQYRLDEAADAIDLARRAAIPSEQGDAVWRTDWQNSPRDGTPVRLRYKRIDDETTLAWSTHYSVYGLGGCWSDGFCTMGDPDFAGWLPAHPAPAARVSDISTADGEAVAWVFELAKARHQQTGEWMHFGPPQLSFTKPNVPDSSILNLHALGYIQPAPAAGVKVKAPKWYHEAAIGTSTPEEWFATTPEGQSLTVTYDESCELPWVARPFPPGPSNYATADEAKAALEAAREARILSALDQGEPK